MARNSLGGFLMTLYDPGKRLPSNVMHEYRQPFQR